MVGVIRRKFDTYGFIRDEEGVDYIYVPSSFQHTTGDDFANTEVGHRVQFEHVVGPKGPRALTIRKLGR